LISIPSQLDEARIYLEELLRQDPDNPDLLYNLGLCYVDLGQLDRGIELLLRCLRSRATKPHLFKALKELDKRLSSRIQIDTGGDVQPIGSVKALV
jgi:tetratricopeptide (TPR) repeat protein